MKKISTLYKKNPENLGLVINEINPENQWVFNGEGIATRKHDGTACAIIDGLLYKRYDAKKGKHPPKGAIPCQDSPDEITGHWPHWVIVDPKTDWQWNEALINLKTIEDGTYELCGPKIQGNPEKLESHQLIKHGIVQVGIGELSFEGLRKCLELNDWEGIVFHHPDGRMCKIRKSDFGIKRLF